MDAKTIEAIREAAKKSWEKSRIGRPPQMTQDGRRLTS